MPTGYLKEIYFLLMWELVGNFPLASLGKGNEN